LDKHKSLVTINRFPDQNIYKPINKAVNKMIYKPINKVMLDPQ